MSSCTGMLSLCMRGEQDVLTLCAVCLQHAMRAWLQRMVTRWLALCNLRLAVGCITWCPCAGVMRLQPLTWSLVHPCLRYGIQRQRHPLLSPGNAHSGRMSAKSMQRIDTTDQRHGGKLQCSTEAWIVVCAGMQYGVLDVADVEVLAWRACCCKLLSKRVCCA